MADWYPDELDLAGPEHLDAEYVASYDAKAQYDATDDCESLIANGVGPRSTVVDLGSGTGTFACSIAPHVAQVIAVDPSPAMTAALRRRTEQLTNVAVIEAGFLTWPATPASVDAVFSLNALHQGTQRIGNARSSNPLSSKELPHWAPPNPRSSQLPDF